MWRHYVYEHIRNDTGAVFYVGKGAFRKNRKSQYERSVATNNRSAYWRNVVAKAGGLTVVIVAHFMTDQDAVDFEISRIAEHGRASLVNLTDGGEGRRNGVFSEIERQKRSIASRGKRSPAWVASIRAARKDGGNGGVVKRGDKLPEPWKRNIAKTKVGAKNPMFGRSGAGKHPTAKRVVDTVTGAEYGSIMAAAKAIGIGFQNLHGMLTGNRTNPTTLRLAA